MKPVCDGAHAQLREHACIHYRGWRRIALFALAVA